MGYWKTKVLPKIQKVFGKDLVKKAAADEACKTFDDSKEEVSKDFEEKKAELQPKVLKIYEASSPEVKTLVKDPKAAALKKHSTKVQKFIDELVKINFPGSKPVCEACSKFGPSLIPGPVLFIFEKVSTFIVTKEKPREVEVPPTQEPSKKEVKDNLATEEKSGETAVEEKSGETAVEEKSDETAAEEKSDETAAEANSGETAAKEKSNETAAEGTLVETAPPLSEEPPKEEKPQDEVPPPTKPEQSSA